MRNEGGGGKFDEIPEGKGVKDDGGPTPERADRTRRDAHGGASPTLTIWLENSTPVFARVGLYCVTRATELVTSLSNEHARAATIT